MPVVYTITNTLTGEQYVGATVNLVNRKSGHLHHFRRGTHHSRAFQESWDKYGEAAFAFAVIEEVENKANLNAREQHWIDTLHPALNRSPTSESPLGVKHSEISRQNMSEAHKGKKLTPAAIAKRTAKQRGMTRTKETRERIRDSLSRPVSQYTRDGIFLKLWRDGREVEEILGIGRSHIRSCCCGKRKTTGGYMWKYGEDECGHESLS